jgi:SNF2 family DNA or RNA helicase
MGYKKDPVGIEILDGLVKGLRQYLVFSNYRMTNKKIMDRYKIGGVYGDITPEVQQEYIKAFKEGTLKAMAVNPQSGGFGLDLPMCQHGILPELPITPRALIQCVTRYHRQGQKETSFATVLVARKTIQESLFKRIMEKDDLMREVVRTAGSLSDDLLANMVKDEPKTREQVFKELRGEI